MLRQVDMSGGTLPESNSDDRELQEIIKFFKRVFTTRLLLIDPPTKADQSQGPREVQDTPRKTVKNELASRTKPVESSKKSSKTTGYPRHWYCGHCAYGPMLVSSDTHCSGCGRARDVYAQVE